MADDTLSHVHRLGDLKKRLHGKASGTKKYTFDWEVRPANTLRGA